MNPDDDVLQPCVTIVFHECDPKVLVQRAESKLFFPRIICPEIYPRAGSMSRFFSTELEEVLNVDLDLIYLYSTFTHQIFEGLPPVIVLFECYRPTSELKLPHRYEWLPIVDAADSLFPDAHDRRAIPYLRRDEGECHELGLRRWEKRGWMKETTTMISQVLSELSYVVIGALDELDGVRPISYQMIVHSDSAMLRLLTDKGVVYFKASHEREGRTMETLSKISPELVRKPLYVNKEKEWMLMENCGETVGRPLSNTEFEKFQVLYGELQLKCLQHMDELVSAGIPVAKPEDILEKLRAVLSNKDNWASFCKNEAAGGVAWADVDACCKDVHELLDRIYVRGKVPLTVVHGDLHSSNICGAAVDDEQINEFAIIDWTTAAIDLPLPDLENFVDQDLYPGKELDKYFDLWKEYASMAELKELFVLGRVKRLIDEKLRRYEIYQRKTEAQNVEELFEYLYYNIRLAAQLVRLR